MGLRFCIWGWLFCIWCGDLGEFNLDRMTKEREIGHLNEKFSKAKASFLVDFKGVDVGQITSLRKGLAGAGAQIKVVRNTLAKVSLKKQSDEKLAKLADHFDGPNAIVFAYEDVPNVAKVLCDFDKELACLKLKIGYMNTELLDVNKIVYLSKLPSKDELRSHFLNILQAVQVKFLRQLKAPGESFVRLLKAKEKKI